MYPVICKSLSEGGESKNVTATRQDTEQKELHPSVSAMEL